LESPSQPGQIVILNGAPRSGKSSIVIAIQETFDGLWMNLGVDVFVTQVTPKRYRPGMGLRPGEEGHRLAPLVPALYQAMYGSIAAHSRAGLNVVVDVGHYDRSILADSARRLLDLPVLFVGVRCPIEVIMERRNAGQPGREDGYLTGPVTDVPAPILRWQRDVHIPGIYDLEVDTSVVSPLESAALIRRRLDKGPPPSAFRRLAARAGGSS
jgi:chloramphenicol 3-O phosphotransferase